MLPSSQSSSTNSIGEMAESAQSASPRLSRTVTVSSWKVGVTITVVGLLGVVLMFGEEVEDNQDGCLNIMCNVSTVQLQMWSKDQEESCVPRRMLFTRSSVAIIWGMQPRAVQVSVVEVHNRLYTYTHVCT